MSLSETYFAGVRELVDLAEKTQGAAIEQAAKACADALCGDGMLYLFGTGHSHILAEEIFYRAGGLARVYPILEEPLMLHTSAARSSQLERMSGYGKIILDDIDGIRPGDVMFVFSNSGRNTLSIDMALEAKKRGMTVICITNKKHTESVTSRHPSGKKLFEVSDIVLDNCGCIGDASVETPVGMVGATSTVIGSLIMNAIVCRAVELCCDAGKKPEVFLSANTDAGDANNEAIIARYKGVIKSL